MAENRVISDDISVAAGDAALALREVARSLGVDPASGADSLVAAVEVLQERFRQARLGRGELTHGQ